MSPESSRPPRLRRRAFTALGVPLAAVAAGLVPAAALAAEPKAGAAFTASSYVYVNLNTSPTNTVAGFSRNSDGSLTALMGSPFTVGGSGTGTTIGSQGSIQVAAGGRLLLVANAGNGSISVMRVNRSGGLSPAAGSPFPSGGMTPATIAVSGQLVYVGNTGDPAANYLGFHLSLGGVLTQIPSSAVPIPPGSTLGDILFSPDGRVLIGALVTGGPSGTGSIDSFAVGRNGLLTPAPTSPLASQQPGPLGSVFNPVRPAQLYVTNAHAGADLGSVSVYQVASNGNLTAIANSPFADGQTAPCWAAVSPSGQYLFVANAGSDSITSFAIAPDGQLKLVQTVALKGGSGAGSLGTFDLGLDPSGSTLYVTDALANQISVLAVSGGTMTELASSPVALPSGSSPYGLAITPAAVA